MARTSSINKYRQQQLIKLKGTKCINCNTDCGDNIIFHHVIPISIGGTENNSNIVPLCTNCHRKLHNISQKNSTISHSELVRAGIKKAKEKGIKVGRKSITINDIPIEFILIIIKLYQMNYLLLQQHSKCKYQELHFIIIKK